MKRTAIIATGIFLSTSSFAANLPRSDENFLEAAARAGYTEVEGSKLAQTKAVGSDVKSFADQMIKDHTASATALNELASNKGMTVPSGPSAIQQAKLKILSAYDGSNFDRHYANQIGVNAHKDAVKLFEKASRNAKDADVKAFAIKTLPTLRHHLEMARALKASTDKIKDNDKQAAVSN